MNHRISLSLLIALLALPTPPSRAAEVKLTQDATSVKVTIDGKDFTTYRFLPGDDKAFLRPFAYPVLATDGVAITSDQVVTNPKEHPHHRSVWVSHGDVNGVDHWSNKDKAVQKHLGFDKAEGDTLVERLEWLNKDPGAPALLKETRTLRFFALDDGTRGIDLTVVLTAANGDVTFGDTKEAGLAAVRVHPEIGTDKGNKAKLSNAKGAAGEKEIWGKPADWCDAS